MEKVNKQFPSIPINHGGSEFLHGDSNILNKSLHQPLGNIYDSTSAPFDRMLRKMLTKVTTELSSDGSCAAHTTITSKMLLAYGVYLE